jgi:protein TonB
VEETSDEVFTYAEEMPKMHGSETAFQEYLQKNIVYPNMEREQGKTGTVYVEFEVGKDGGISNVKTVRPVAGAPGFSREAERVIRAMPPWEPGKMNGRPVKIKMTVPVRFELQ